MTTLAAPAVPFQGSVAVASYQQLRNHNSYIGLMPGPLARTHDKHGRHALKRVGDVFPDGIKV
eukprot:93785-Pelagomonas_calceolata.AAC.2